MKFIDPHFFVKLALSYCSFKVKKTLQILFEEEKWKRLL